MSKNGYSPDNAACESLFSRIKNEFFYNQDRKDVTIEEFVYELDLYLQWYNGTENQKIIRVFESCGVQTLSRTFRLGCLRNIRTRYSF